MAAVPKDPSSRPEAMAPPDSQVSQKALHTHFIQFTGSLLQTGITHSVSLLFQLTLSLTHPHQEQCAHARPSYALLPVTALVLREDR